ncbi:MAG: hypothetical protein ACLFQJ_02135 [Campylobacterales bacterium]
MEVGASSNSLDYTIEKQYFDGRRNEPESSVEKIKQNIKNRDEESSDPEVMQMISQLTGLGQKLDIAI